MRYFLSVARRVLYSFVQNLKNSLNAHASAIFFSFVYNNFAFFQVFKKKKSELGYILKCSFMFITNHLENERKSAGKKFKT